MGRLLHPSLRRNKINDYDSKIEEQFHRKHPDLIYVSDNHQYFPQTFYDASGAPFKATPDFYDRERNLVIELKGRQLNNVKTKVSSQENLQKQQSYKGCLSSFDQLKYGFNHSVFKQGKVCRGLRDSNYQYSLLIVFTDDTKLTTQAINKMKSEKLDWCFVTDYQCYQLQYITNKDEEK